MLKEDKNAMVNLMLMKLMKILQRAPNFSLVCTRATGSTSNMYRPRFRTPLAKVLKLTRLQSRIVHHYPSNATLH
jgi:hypothetical protein